MSSTDTLHNSELVDGGSTAGGCGCGGCGCGSVPDASAASTAITEITATQETSMTTQTYSVTGMTCGHCASAVTSELTAVDGVTDVQVDLVAGGTSTVTITSDQHLEDAQVAAALDEAGDYQLA